MDYLFLFSLIVGIVLLLFAICNLIVFLGFRKENIETANGYLTETISEKNVYKGGHNGRWHKNWVNYVYSYRVNGISYTIEGGGSGTKQGLSTVVKIIYQKKHPKRAYIRGMTIPMNIIYAIALFVIAIMLLIPSILYFT